MTVRSVAAMLSVEAIVLAAIALVALDIRAHKRVELLGGVNMWGYRGTVAHQKQPNEVRIAVIGGDLAFGWGVAAEETFTAYLRHMVGLDLDRAGGTGRLVTAVNLGARGLARAEYGSWLEHFGYLAPDIVCVLADPASHTLRDGRFLPDRRSVVFSTFGYSPILPLVLQERGVLSRSTAIGAAGRLLALADFDGADQAPVSADATHALQAAVDAAAKMTPMGVVVVMPPDADAGLRAAIVPGARIRVVDLADVPALRGDDLRLDRFHLSAGGNSRAADAVAPAVLQLVHAAEAAPR